jgi:hypothetical protein
MKEPSMKHLAFVLLVLLGTTAHAATFTSGLPHSTDNDDSCDIALLPAATLLLPYFEVDLADPRGETTLFTITNASPLEQIAHVTLWTDYGFPVIDFNVYLTGYDVQGLNLYDVIAEGQLAPPRGTGFDDPGSPEGDYSDDNPAIQRETCRNLPMALASVYLTRMQQAFTQGSVAPLGGSPGCSRIGGVHPHATGYATIDVSRRCGILMPTDPAYYTDEIAFDNVLTGDFMQVNGNQNFAQGNPLVHIRAVPEGGTSATRASDPALRSNLPRTFYGRFQSAASPTADGRQPLPSSFMARWISGEAGSLESSFKIWREGNAGPNADCTVYRQNEHIPVGDIVRFDEEENAVAVNFDCPFLCVPPFSIDLPASSRLGITDERIPRIDNGAVAGWLYLNLHDSTSLAPAAQAWVVASMRAEGRFSVDMDVTALGNGCTSGTRPSEVTDPENGAPIGPAERVNP